MLVSPKWQATPSVYGPVATWTQLFAAWIGGARPWLTIWVLMIMTGAAFLVTGYVLLRTAENPVRAVLLWVANPLLIVELVIGGHLDAFACAVRHRGDRHVPAVHPDRGMTWSSGCSSASRAASRSPRRSSRSPSRSR